MKNRTLVFLTLAQFALVNNANQFIEQNSLAGADTTLAEENFLNGVRGGGDTPARNICSGAGADRPSGAGTGNHFFDYKKLWISSGGNGGTMRISSTHGSGVVNFENPRRA